MNGGPQGVYFAKADYATAGRRVTTFVVDLFILWFLVLTILTAMQMTAAPKTVWHMKDSPERRHLLEEAMRPYRIQFQLGALLVIVGYHIFLRTSRGGTIGYRITRVRLVNEFGEPPDLATCLKRFAFGALPCMLLGVAYLPCLSDPQRRSVHDRWAGTWIVRKKAKPAGAADVLYEPKMIGPWMIQSARIVPAHSAEIAGGTAVPQPPPLATAVPPPGPDTLIPSND